VKSACGDGNYILGLVTPSSGRFDPALVDKLGEAGLWLRRYGKSVYETRGGPYKRTSLYGSTCRGNQIYVHIFDSAVTNLVLPGLPKKVVGCSMLNGGQATVSQSSEAVTLNVSPNDVESPTTIVVLELDGSAEQITPIGEIPLNRGVEVRTSNENPSADRSASDGNLHTFWKSDGKSKRPWLEYDLVSAKSISRAILFEGEYEGELANIHRYQIEVKIGDAWKQVADVTPWGFEKGQETDFDTWPLSVFHPEIRFAPVSAQHVRLTIIRFTDTPVIHEFELYER
jgi:alpha-L-fucosidase